jgi:hypothetical protein
LQRPNIGKAAFENLWRSRYRQWLFFEQRRAITQRRHETLASAGCQKSTSADDTTTPKYSPQKLPSQPVAIGWFL